MSDTATSTIRTHLHALQTAHQVRSLPYLHPYAPASRKGKERDGNGDLSVQEQLDILAQLRKAVIDARSILATPSSSGVKDDGRGKLAKELREVTNHQSNLLPLTASLASSSTSTNRSLSQNQPSRLTRVSPIEVLRTLAAQVDIQIYLEDSQFGLLKTSLALAGVCFVVDVDLEVDAVEGEEEDGEGNNVESAAEQGQIGLEEINQSTAINPPGKELRAGQEDREGKGRYRLSKITVNHVQGDVTGKSEWIAKVLRGKLEVYLGIWNRLVALPEDERPWGAQVEMELAIRALGQELGDLKALDQLAEALGSEAEADLFTNVDKIGPKIEEYTAEQSPEEKLYPSTRGARIFPSFTLLPGQAGPNPTFRIRPRRRGEDVPEAASPGDIEADWIHGSWIIEIVPDPSGYNKGMSVRSNWLSAGGSDVSTSWDGLARVEHLLYRPEGNLDPGPAFLFPYTTDFVHSPANPSSGANGSTGLEQRWAMVEPGPEGFIIGRIALPNGLSGFKQTIECLRRQLVLNQLFCSIFKADKVDLESGADLDDFDDLMQGPAALAITYQHAQSAIRLSMPIPHQQHDPSATVEIVLRPSSSPPFVESQISANSTDAGVMDKAFQVMATAQADSLDLVGFVRAVEAGFSASL